MSKMLEIPDDVYDELAQTAKNTGKTFAEIIRARVREHQEPPHPVSAQEKQAGLQKLLQYAGILDSGDPHSTDNDRIDADLQREYGHMDEG